MPDEAVNMLDYAERARDRFAAIQPERLPLLVNHGDLIGGNVEMALSVRE